MDILSRFLTRSWLLRGVAVLALLLGGAAAPAALANDSAATITLLAPGATPGALVTVEYQTPGGQWFTVTGWTGNLEVSKGTDLPFKKWSVLKEQFGQGPFRWVVFAQDGKTVWATSDVFELPHGGGMELTQTIRPDNLATYVPATTVAKSPIQAAVAEAAKVPVLFSGNAVWSSGCTDSCDHSKISTYAYGMSADTLISVEWLDGLGQWHLVQSWSGKADKVLDNGALFKQWTVEPDIYGKGPFRWIYTNSITGQVMGASANFNLPGFDGINTITYVTWK